jgi:hypothetical protein
MSEPMLTCLFVICALRSAIANGTIFPEPLEPTIIASVKITAPG